MVKIILTVALIFFISIGTIVFKKTNELKLIKDNGFSVIEIKESKEKLLGRQVDYGLREEVFHWVLDQNFIKSEKNAFINLAIADTEVFNVFDQQQLSNDLFIKQQERYSCILYRYKKDKKRFFNLLGKLRMTIFNTEERVNAFYNFNKLKTNREVRINEINKKEICDKYFNSIVPIN